ncbi:MAG: PAS domain S-box protein [Chitinophagaceae bacterium]|nr:PAS domain S-box protein [Oligoflexus sp.]
MDLTCEELKATGATSKLDYFPTNGFESKSPSFNDQAWEAVFRCAPAALSFNDLSGRFTAANPSFLRLTGYSLEEITKIYAFEITHIDDRAECQMYIGKLINGEIEHFDLKKRMFRRDGSIMLTRLTVSLVKDQMGTPLHLMSMTEDITEKTRADESLRRHKERLSAIMNYTNVGVNLVGLDGTFIEVNPAFSAMLGYNTEDLPQMTMKHIIHADDLPQTYKNIADLLEQKISFVRTIKKMLHKDGNWIWAEAAVSVAKDMNGNPEYLVALIQDISERIESQSELKSGKEQLRKAEERMRLATEAANMGIWDYNPVLDTLEQSERAHEIMGTQEQNLAHYKDILHHVHPADHALVLKIFDQCFQSPDKSYNDGFNQIVVRVLHADGETHWVQISSQVLFEGANTSRTPTRAIAALLDVTEQSQHAEELKNARDAAEVANATKSSFLANMSHEIRTPLSSILGFSKLLLTEQGSDQDRAFYHDTVVRNGQVLEHLIDDILDLSKVEAGRMELEKVQVALFELIEETLNIFRHKAQEKNITLCLRSTGNLPPVILTDPTRLRQILINLIGNAIKFTNQGGVEITAGLSPSAEKEIHIKVEDTGIGLTDEQKLRLFQPFSQADNSTTRKFGGTGLGLHLAKRLANAMSGDLRLVESAVDKGSSFLFQFAVEVVPAEEIFSTPALDDFNFDLNGLSILVVEDSPDIQFLLVNILESSGAKVVVAGNGEEAVAFEALQAFHLILMDIQMPVMDGYEATRQLRVQGCSIPIVALTAHAMIDERQRTRDAGFTHHLTKPVNGSELLRITQELTSPLARRESVQCITQ